MIGVSLLLPGMFLSLTISLSDQKSHHIDDKVASEVYLPFLTHSLSMVQHAVPLRCVPGERISATSFPSLTH